MEFKTDLKLSKNKYLINFDSKIITLGSCFSNVVGDFFESNKFFVKNNVFGTVYNLSSIAKLLQNTIQQLPADSSKIIERDEMFFHYDYHSDFRAKSKAELYEKIGNVHQELFDFLKSANWLFITLGTSWIYEKQDEVVSNCHKIPASQFNKRILSYEEQILELDNLFKDLRGFNPNLKVVFTVSPVRHIKDGIVENSLSKSILRMVADYASKQFENVFYFPSYEIMMDDLRDYRFYKSDLIHPTEMAENYILDKFKKVYFSEETLNVIEEWRKIRMALNHKPFNVESASHQSFLVNLQKKIEAFSAWFGIEEELSQVKAQIKKN